MRALRPRRYLTTNAIRAPSTITRISAAEDGDEDEGVVDPVGVRRMSLAGEKTPVAGVGDSRRHEGDQDRSESGKGGPAHAEWHRIERGSAEPCGAARRGRRRLRGVRQRRPAGSRRRLRPGRPRRSSFAVSWPTRGGSGSGGGPRSSSASPAPIAGTTRSTSCMPPTAAAPWSACVPPGLPKTLL